MKKRINLLILMVFVAALFLSACSTSTGTVSTTTAATSETTQAATTAETTSAATGSTSSLAFNNNAWNYDSTNNVYWQIGIQYVTNPASTDYETLGIYVPGAYVNATANSDGTYSIAINDTGTMNGFTAKTAPMVFPINTGGYAAQNPPTSYNYNDVSSYLEAGFIYVWAGMRGRNMNSDTYIGGAPWGVTDLKAAVRYIRYNKDVLPGNTESIFVFGMSGGGAQSTVVGASGDSALYTPYLESIGAAMTDANGQTLSDAVDGVMAWCPITSLDYADEAYEWNMGQFVSTGTRADGTFTSALSKDLATAYAEYINNLGLKDQNGNALSLTASSTGIYTSGTYYDYLVSVIQQSLNNFLADTTFPYTLTSGHGAGPGGGMTIPQGGTAPTGGMPNGGPQGGASANSSSSSQTSTTFATVQDYIDYLNQDVQWVTYDASTNTAKITSLADFVTTSKNPSKSVGAFDDLSRSQAENNVFGIASSTSLHFDAVMAELLAKNASTYATYSDWKAQYVTDYANDLTQVDSLGTSVQTRVNMMNPMYYLMNYYAGYQTSTVATYWRINTGIDQGDTANTVEVNLALALQADPSVKDVEFTTVWGLGHTQAERSGDATTNFINWVVQTAQK